MIPPRRRHETRDRPIRSSAACTGQILQENGALFELLGQRMAVIGVGGEWPSPTACELTCILVKYCINLQYCFYIQDPS